jgi:hypothetical protein
MTSAPTTDREFSTAEFFALAKTRLSLDVSRELTDPRVAPRIDYPDVDPEVIAASQLRDRCRRQLCWYP